MHKVLFITGTRADYGKIKTLIRAIENEPMFEAYIYVSGMHLMPQFGNTYQEVLKDGYKNVYVDFAQVNYESMSQNLGNVICNLTSYVNRIAPDMIVVHGDRVDALAGAIVGALNNIKVAHIEGGEVSGTIDESIRHAISKFAHIHLVCNEDAKKRLMQLGEEEKRIYVIGSPDIDVMLSDTLPDIDVAKNYYGIDFESYGILMYHPVTTEYEIIEEKAKAVTDAVIESEKNYIVIYPNNDLGSSEILREYKRFKDNKHFKVFPSLRFEYFLTLLRHAEFMIGNSSAGVRETSVYGVPAIDIGIRQNGRYIIENSNIQHVTENKQEILNAINDYAVYRKQKSDFGKGNSTEKFMEILRTNDVWEFEIQKRFVDRRSTIS